jgi:hypothetical protein
MKLPKEIKEAIKDCILHVIWPKEEIMVFFKKQGCTKIELGTIRKPKDLTRAKIVHLIFRQLSYRNDGGAVTFMKMNKTLLNWKSFNKHYFDDLKLLKREDAEKAILNLADVQSYLDE